MNQEQTTATEVIFLLSNTEFFKKFVSFPYFSLNVHFVPHAKIAVSLRSETSETTFCFLKSEIFSFPFSKRNERHTLARSPFFRLANVSGITGITVLSKNVHADVSNIENFGS
jgi:hypothetical protein